MKKLDAFHEFVMGDLLADIPHITSKRMFGGYGIYKQGLIFAFIIDGLLYFKVDDTNKPDYEAYGSEPFTYTMPNKKKFTMSYWRVPEDIMENRETFATWVAKAFQASARVPRFQKKKK